mmetsp:Transcript_15944/g.30074  ORF Transcript_15944/g.30074 Transcript_15944/m.30074 type:complete len:365 (+) Transcript_15944:155-1249(+)
MAPDVCTPCGWISAFVSCICFGSFAVPVKSKRATECNIDPLAFQTYKTFMCLITSFLTLPLFHQTFQFTPWGIVSGLFWVPAGVSAIYAVQNAGLAVSQGLWSSIIVLVSFGWGIGIFHESVRSNWIASAAVLIMVAGLWGMSYYSSPSDGRHDIDQDEGADSLDRDSNEPSSRLGYDRVATETTRGEDDLFENDTIDNGIWRRRRLGIIAAVFNGIWGGSVMVPMQYAPVEAVGTGYVISFAIGATIVTISLWLARFLFNLYQSDMNVTYALTSLPSLHLKTMWLPGAIAGTLWSIGNIASMISVRNLGEGVGYSLTQSSMLVSGLWGIFYFNEVQSMQMKIMWFLSAGITLVGILGLTYEHV